MKISDLQLKIIIEQENLGLPRGPGISVVYEMAQELLQRRQAEQKNLMCWDLQNMEEGGDDPECLAEIVADTLCNGMEHTIDVQIATLLPNRKMRVWLTGGEDREVHWEWVE